jgi:hypothetical protein
MEELNTDERALLLSLLSDEQILIIITAITSDTHTEQQ